MRRGTFHISELDPLTNLYAERLAQRALSEPTETNAREPMMPVAREVVQKGLKGRI